MRSTPRLGGSKILADDVGPLWAHVGVTDISPANRGKNVMKPKVVARWGPCLIAKLDHNELITITRVYGSCNISYR